MMKYVLYATKKNCTCLRQWSLSSCFALRAVLHICAPSVLCYWLFSALLLQVETWKQSHAENAFEQRCSMIPWFWRWLIELNSFWRQLPLSQKSAVLQCFQLSWNPSLEGTKQWLTPIPCPREQKQKSKLFLLLTYFYVQIAAKTAVKDTEGGSAFAGLHS